MHEDLFLCDSSQASFAEEDLNHGRQDDSISRVHQTFTLVIVVLVQWLWWQE
jgi:hypothetical protein